MAILKRITSAETSSNLMHKEAHCDVDVLGAVGMVTIGKPGHIAIFRCKFLYDPNSLPEAKDQFRKWAARSLINRKGNPKLSREIGDQALKLWLDDNCPKCKGHGYRTLENSDQLQQAVCPSCNSTGKQATPGNGLRREVLLDIFQRAEESVEVLRRNVISKLRP